MTHAAAPSHLYKEFGRSDLSTGIRKKAVRSTLLSVIYPATLGGLVARVGVATLVARLAYHARAIGRVEPDDEADLLDWACKPIVELLGAVESSSYSDPLTRATLSLDPVGLYLAVAVLAKSGRCIGGLERLSAWRMRLERELGVGLISPENLAYFNSLSTDTFDFKNQGASATRVIEITSGRVADASVLANALLIESRWGVLAFEPSIELEQISRTLRLIAWRSARQRDIRSLGLALVGMGLTSCPCPPELTEWLERMIRADGLLGAWDLFRENSPLAQLKATVDMYFGLHAVLAPAVPLSPIQATLSRQVSKVSLPEVSDQCISFSELDISELSAIALRILCWLGRHISRFRLVPGVASKQEFADRVKQFVELLIVLDLLSRPSQYGPGRFSNIARQFIAEMEDHLDWEGLPEALRLYPSTCLAALYLPLLEKLVGRTSVHHEEVEELVRHPFSRLQERTPMRSLDYHYLLSRFGGDDSTDKAWADLTLLSGNCNPVLFSSDSLYDITHAVFYLTRFGQVSIQTASQIDWLRKYVPTLAVSSVMEGDPDVGAELVLTAAYANLPFTSDLGLALRLLAGSVRSDGSIEGPIRPELDTLDTFERCYHTCLVTLVAIDEALRRWAVSGDSIEQHVEELEAAACGRRLLNALADGFRLDETGTSNEHSRHWICTNAKGERHVLVEHCSLVEPRLAAVRSSLEAHRCAALAGMAPELIGSALESTNSIAYLRRFADGASLLESQESSLSTIYSHIGTALLALHKVAEMPPGGSSKITPLLPLWRRAVTDISPSSEHLAWLAAIEHSSKDTILHGDPHAGNLIRSTDKKLIFIDFEYSGTGPIELDLGIALSYVNTTPIEVRDCASALLDAYGLSPARWRDVVAAAAIAPIYAAWIHAGLQRPPDAALSVALEQSVRLRAALLSLTFA